MRTITHLMSFSVGQNLIGTVIKIIRFSLVAIITLTVFGCSAVNSRTNPTEDTRYLTPIPESTLMAFRLTPPVTSKLQAVIFARQELGTTRLHFLAPPSVYLVEETTLDKALETVGRSGMTSYTDVPGDTKVWLVVFEGEVQIIPPVPTQTATLAPYRHGCASVIINVDNLGGAGVSGTACPAIP